MEIKHIAQTPPVIIGNNALQELPKIIAKWSRKSILLVSDEGLASTGLVDSVHHLLQKALPASVFLAPAGEPKVATVQLASETVREMDAPLVVGLGGGTALDIAKLTAGLAVSQHAISHYLLCANAWQGCVPKIMIPTTSGTGAEVTRTCVLSDQNGNKSWAWGDELSPELVVLDPQTSKSMPQAITVMTGLDALVHAIEAATSQKRDAFSIGNALQAIHLVAENLPLSVAEPENLVARSNMQQAAYLAGIAIDNCGTGIAHNIGHALGTLYHIPHGVAVTLGLAASISWSLENHASVYDQVAEVLHCDVRQLSSVLEDLFEKVNFADCVRRYSNIDIDPAMLAKSMQTEENLPMALNNSRVPDDSDWLSLAEETQLLFKHLCIHNFPASKIA